jgi:DNA mismatch repair ATPase MutS
MKVHLMHVERSFEPKAAQPAQARDLTHDLGLVHVFAAMAGTDAFLMEIVKAALFSSLDDPQAIGYRQHVLRDCLENTTVVREIYAVVVEAMEGEKRVWRTTLNRYPDRVLYWSVQVLSIFFSYLRRLRDIAVNHVSRFESTGFRSLLNTLITELDDRYLNEVDRHLRHLHLRNGVLLSATLGSANKGDGYVLREPKQSVPQWQRELRRMVDKWPRRNRNAYVFQLAERDESGLNALLELRNLGLGRVAGTLGQAADHVRGFFAALRTELAFYIGCLNLRERLAEKDAPIAFAEPLPAVDQTFSGSGLYDVSLCLTQPRTVIRNAVDAPRKPLIMITGANRGGKTTMLRALGQAQLMMQAGMFVPGESMRASVCDGLFTHFKREEDPGMKSGKFDEELARMSWIVERLRPHARVLFNESFAATNPREGAKIAGQIVRGLLARGVTVVFVTHLFDLADDLYRHLSSQALFLRAERLDDGRRTFRLLQGAPLPTSYGQDVFLRIFAADAQFVPEDLPA